MNESRLLTPQEIVEAMSEWKDDSGIAWEDWTTVMKAQDTKTRAETLQEVLVKMICVRHFNQYLPEGYDMWEMKPSDYLALKRGELPKE